MQYRLLEAIEKSKSRKILKINDFISEEFKNQESDVVYKIKNKKIFVLIEHQSKIDYKMPKRILDYEIEIMKTAENHNVILKKKDAEMPIIIPIVTYTGRKKWNVAGYIQDCRKKLNRLESFRLGNYYIIDNNTYTDEELLEDKFFISKLMLLERMKTTEELYTNLKKVIRQETNERNIKLLENIIKFIYKNKLDKDYSDKLIKEIAKKSPKKKGENDMILEMIENENKALIRKGKKERSIEIAKNMLKEKVDIDFIMRMTGLTKEQILK